MSTPFILWLCWVIRRQRAAEKGLLWYQVTLEGTLPAGQGSTILSCTPSMTHSSLDPRLVSPSATSSQRTGHGRNNATSSQRTGHVRDNASSPSLAQHQTKYMYSIDVWETGLISLTHTSFFTCLMEQFNKESNLMRSYLHTTQLWKWSSWPVPPHSHTSPSPPRWTPVTHTNPRKYFSLYFQKTDIDKKYWFSV